jgi:isopropylmalate/homocitrate/citramalate synthase
MIDKDRVWTGSINAEAGTDIDSVDKVGLYDSTLRDGEQTVGVNLGPEQKLEIAIALDGLGVDRIEAGFPRVSDDDVKSYELIMEAGLGAEIWGFSRAVPADIEQLLELGVRGSVIESPVSDGKLEAYGMTRDSVLDRTTTAVRWAAENDVTVCYFAVDSTRADLGFLAEIYKAAVEAGAEELAVVDTLGIASPETAEFLTTKVRSWVGDEVPIHWHGHNDFGLATAGSIAAVRAGATWVQGTVNGMGERAGNANLPEFALALEALYGVSTNMRFEKLQEVSELVRRISGYQLEPYKPLTGYNLFVRESGAVAAQFHDPQAVEPYSSELVNAERGIVLGKKSGLASIDIKSQELGLSIPEEKRGDVLAAVKSFSVSKGGLVSDEEFITLTESLVTQK